MLNIFNNLSTRVKGVHRFAEWEYVRSGLQMNLESVNRYYRNGAYAVASSHELVKLLYGLFTSVDLDLQSYYKRVDIKALTVAQQLGFTTVMSKGRIFTDVFFTGGSKEVIIVTDDGFDPVEVTKNWRDVRPITVLRHGFDQIDCFPLTGRVKSKGLSVFAINLSMLAVQYRAYRQWQNTYTDDSTGRNSIYHFLFAYPIGNMIYSAMDHAVFNRMIRLSQGMPTSDNEFRHPFHVTNFTLRADRLLLKTLDYIRDSQLDMGGIAMATPAVDLLDGYELLKLPDLYESRQLNWAIYLARIDMLLFLLSFDSVWKKSQDEIGKIKYDLRSYLIDGTIQSSVPKELFKKQKIVIERFLKG